MKLFDAVILTTDLRDGIIDDLRGTGLHRGDCGNIVEVYPDGETFIVEFFEDGETVAVADARVDQLRPMTSQDIAARRISA